MKLAQFLLLLIIGITPIIAYGAITQTKDEPADNEVLISGEKVAITCVSDSIPSIQERITNKEKELQSLDEADKKRDIELRNEINDLNLQIDRLAKTKPHKIYAISNDLLGKIQDDKDRIYTEIKNQEKNIIESELENTQGMHALEVLAQQKINIQEREKELTDKFNKEFNDKTKAINEKGLSVIDEIESTEEEIKLAEDADPDDFSSVTLFLLRVRLTLLKNKLKSLQKEIDSLKAQKEKIFEAQEDAYRGAYDEIRDAILDNAEATEAEKGRIIRSRQTSDLIELKNDYLLNEQYLDKAGLYCMTQLEKIKKDLPVRTIYETPFPYIIQPLTPLEVIRPRESKPIPKKILPFGNPRPAMCKNGVCPTPPCKPA